MKVVLRLAYLLIVLAGVCAMAHLVLNSSRVRLQRSCLVLTGERGGDRGKACVYLRTFWPESEPYLRKAARSRSRAGVAAALEALREQGALDPASVLIAHYRFLATEDVPLDDRCVGGRASWCASPENSFPLARGMVWENLSAEGLHESLAIVRAGVELGMRWPYDFLCDLADSANNESWPLRMGNHEMELVGKTFKGVKATPSRRQLRRMLHFLPRSSGLVLAPEGPTYGTLTTWWPNTISFCVERAWRRAEIVERLAVVFAAMEAPQSILDPVEALGVLLAEPISDELRKALEDRMTRGGGAERLVAGLALLSEFDIVLEETVAECLTTGKMRGPCVALLLARMPEKSPILQELARKNPRLSLPVSAILVLAGQRPSRTPSSFGEVGSFPGAAEAIALFMIAQRDPHAIRLVRKYELGIPGVAIDGQTASISDEVAEDARERLSAMVSMVVVEWIDPMAHWPAHVGVSMSD